MTDFVTVGESRGLFRADDIGPLLPRAISTFSFADLKRNVEIGLAGSGSATASRCSDASGTMWSGK
jgi:hypothetical protein